MRQKSIFLITENANSKTIIKFPKEPKVQKINTDLPYPQQQQNKKRSNPQIGRILCEMCVESSKGYKWVKLNLKMLKTCDNFSANSKVSKIN